MRYNQLGLLSNFQAPGPDKRMLLTKDASTFVSKAHTLQMDGQPCHNSKAAHSFYVSYTPTACLNVSSISPLKKWMYRL